MRHDQHFLTAADIERLLFFMPTCAREATNEWARTFATDMAKRAHWRNWRPTAKQAAIMAKMVSELFSDDDGRVIE